MRCEQRCEQHRDLLVQLFNGPTECVACISIELLLSLTLNKATDECINVWQAS